MFVLQINKMPRTPGSRNWDNDEIFKLLDAFQHLAQQDQGFRTMMRETQAGELHTELAKRGVLASVDQVESKMKRLRKNLMDWNLPGVLLN